LKKLRILWASAGIHTNSGYGRVARAVTTRLKNLGYDIINFNPHLLVSPCYIEDILQLPRGFSQFGEDTIPTYYKLYNRNLLLTLWDVWVLRWIKKYELNWIPYVPIDSELDEYTYEINEPLNYEQCKAVITMSEFGRREVKKVLKSDKPVFMIPHGVDTKLYKPMDKRSARKVLGIPEDSFVFGCVAGNYGDRKDLPCLLKAFSLFLKDNPDARDCYLLLWTNVQPITGASFDILRLAKRYGVAKQVLTPKVQPPTAFYDDSTMVYVFNSMNWHVLATRGEGFCLPVIESMSCGVPNIVPKHSALVELVEGRGILVEPSMRILTLTVPTHQEYPVCRPERVAEAMSRAYNMNVEKLSRTCRKFAEKYDWDLIIKRWVSVLEAVEELI